MPNDEDEWSFNVVYKSFISKSLFLPVLKSFNVHLNKINKDNYKVLNSIIFEQTTHILHQNKINKAEYKYI